MHHHITNEPTGIIVPHPADFAVVSEFKNPLNDVTGVFLRFNGFRVNVPKK